MVHFLIIAKVVFVVRQVLDMPEQVGVIKYIIMNGGK